MNNDDQNIDLKIKARGLYWQGWKISAIAKTLQIKPETISSWFRWEHWNDVSSLRRVINH